MCSLKQDFLTTETQRTQSFLLVKQHTSTLCPLCLCGSISFKVAFIRAYLRNYYSVQTLSPGNKPHPV
jgi:hypothetical protein